MPIIYEQDGRPDGRTVVVNPAPGFDPEAIAAQAVPAGVEWRIVTDDEAAAIVAAEVSIASRLADIDRRLADIDAASARPLRAVIVGTATQGDRDRLAELEQRAQALRQERAHLTAPPVTDGPPDDAEPPSEPSADT